MQPVITNQLISNKVKFSAVVYHLSLRNAAWGYRGRKPKQAAKYVGGRLVGWVFRFGCSLF